MGKVKLTYELEVPKGLPPGEYEAEFVGINQHERIMTARWRVLQNDRLVFDPICSQEKFDKYMDDFSPGKVHVLTMTIKTHENRTYEHIQEISNAL